YGFRREAAQVFSGLFKASNYIDLRRLPELFCGFPRQLTRGPTFYPVACSPQAWAAAAPIAMLSACAGLSFDPAASTVTVNSPALPAFLDSVTFRRLSVPEGSIDVKLQRSGVQVLAEAIGRQGNVRLVIT